MEFIFDPSLVLYVPLWKRDGILFPSDDAHGYSCVTTGTQWRPNGRYFDGSSWITISEQTALDGMEELTVMVWFNTTNVTAKTIIGKHWSGADGSYYIQTQNSSFVNVAVTNATTRVIHTVSYATPMSTWLNFCGRYDGATIQFFVNGEKQGGDTAQTGKVQDNARGLSIGALDTTGTGAFVGLIGEVLIYKRALNPLEIQRNYLATKWRYRG